MRLTNATGLPVSWTAGFQRDGRELLVVIAKATYVFPAAGGQASLAAEQVPLVQEDQFSGEPGLSAPLYESDYAHGKPACDVLLVGSAYAPPGRRVTRTVVGIQVGALQKQFAVIGPRVWRSRVLGVTASDPMPFESLFLSYDCAFGGTDPTKAASGHTSTFLANPVGTGFGRHAEYIDGRPLPNTEQVDHPVQKHDGDYVPMGLTPIGRNWIPRRRHAGTYDQAWLENTAPLWPNDFDERYFQAAPPDQTMPYPEGGEEVVLRNLTPDGHCAFCLPARRMPMTFIPHNGRDVTRNGILDTIVFEPDHRRFTLTWRVTLPLGKSVFDVRETVVGEMSAAWHRARRSPGKPYFNRLGEAVETLRRKRSRS